MTEFSLEWHGEEISKDVLKAVEKQIKKETEVLLGASMVEVPFMDGDLQASGDTDISIEGQKVIGTVFYDTPYAVRLHEHPEYNFGNGRKGKYLEDPYNALEKQMMKRIEEAVRFALLRFS